MLAEWREFEHLMRQPGNPSVAIILCRDGRTITEAKSEFSDARTTDYPVVHGQPALIDFSCSLVRPDVLTASGISPIKRRPNWLRITKGWLFGTANLSAQNVVSFRDHVLAYGIECPLVLMIGAGTKGAGTDGLYETEAVRQIAFDIYPSAHTHFIADAHQIPLATGSVDGVCIQAVLEHVINPEQVVSEISRVLKPGGLVYAETPFMQQVHEGAYDFTRFTEVGHRWLFRKFETISRGALGGPGLSLYWAAKYFVRGLTRSRWLGDVFSLPFALAALMDRMIREDHKIDGSNGAYFLGRLTGTSISLSSIVDEYRGAQR
ncbi:MULTISPECIES: class I SAM-dependent methyltransferase [unclassified Mesorhizobium]|uniref:class I SAM-dependent methyltransferase n=1 Tax=unclassified Mesorhizobium TaxID=325217 RepID=UPI000FE96F62|nr:MULTISPECIES: class I SAM-dependent methyltransferase [unclassified Mesorhizobium]RWI30087.1 MAG: class I SAM-dependent methyltransferase [Mesorhizobium sp.]RWK53338.1 MAG: class I SAM-dependent methyltransferase [Mesorhizobium sp.]RWK98457.1 MAG: class I SAM-dependent methyltransferase [Mesorhizobium sp.]TIP61444.1 MAG: class I SAM-dependent methyltransferase [Mesorhizobium sp.]TIQ00999.1 MAG: class I SAM-dependent methyltransferase [Mesorhizobium sp.]